ncbi:MAG TPA: peptidylprolyl isomerase [Beijerinckiaceae bacterium]|nr:peptidylprolyl isomerase [Beijerinckiaceae bacterium]
MLLPSVLRPLLLSSVIVLPLVAWAQPKQPLASVDGTPIIEEDLKTALDDLGQSVERMGEAQRRKYLIDYMIDLRLISRAAEKEKLGEGPDFARKLAYMRERALMETLMARIGAEATTPEKLKAFYDEAVKGLGPEIEVRARHILVPTEDEAKKAHARVTGGEDFAKVAGELSKDPGSGKEGGDLGFFTKDRMVPEFGEAAFGMKPGEISKPVKSQFGWHVIKLEERREKPVPPLEEVKEELTRYLVQKAQQEMILKLRSAAKIDRPAEPAAPATPPKQ